MNIHSFQDTFYPNGISQYSKKQLPDETVVVSPGFSNIEFEQAVFNDIVNGNYKAFEHGTSEQVTAYANWVNTLTSQQATYPNLTPGTVTYNNFITQFNSF